LEWERGGEWSQESTGAGVEIGETGGAGGKNLFFFIFLRYILLLSFLCTHYDVIINVLYYFFSLFLFCHKFYTIISNHCPSYFS
jgi:hypothetical protein